MWLSKIKTFIRLTFYRLRFFSIILASKNVWKQLIDVKRIPIIIINFNQLYYLKILINFLVDRNFKKIVIIDNLSTYPPLLKFYNEISEKVTIEFMDKNYGHMVFFKNTSLQEKFGKGFFVITDSDVIPNKNLPKKFMWTLITKLIKYNYTCSKVGFALRIDNLPKENPLTESNYSWEQKYWKTLLEKNIYSASIDTTFALYKPNFKYTNQSYFIKGIRIAGNFIAEHGGWYINPNALTDEQKYYFETASTSSTVSQFLKETGHI